MPDVHGRQAFRPQPVGPHGRGPLQPADGNGKPLVGRPPTWRLVVDPPRPGAWNMALDEALLEAVGSGESPPTLRFYGWDPPCLSLGAFQPVADINPGACAELGIDLVRRPTGGRAVLHHHEVTYAVVLPRAAAGRPREAYLKICRAILRGLAGLGIRADFAPAGSHRRAAGPSCFAAASDYEVLVGGRKLVGSAQVWRSGNLLQHGSVLLAADGALWARLMGWPEAAEGLVGLLEVDPGLSFERVAAALAGGFAAEFGVSLVPGGWRPAELEHAAKLVWEKYGQPGWTERV